MIDAKHTPEPWNVTGRAVRAHTPLGRGALLLLAQDHFSNLQTPEEEKAANAARAAACVNGCEGINPEAVPFLLDALAPVFVLGVDCADSTHPGGVDVALNYNEFEAIRAALAFAAGFHTSGFVDEAAQYLRRYPRVLRALEKGSEDDRSPGKDDQ